MLVLVEDRTRERRVEAIRRDFVANVSHELKTPVGALNLLAEAVEEAADDPEAVSRFAGRMQTESARLTRLVQQIIELSRLQGDDPLDDPQPVDVDDGRRPRDRPEPRSTPQSQGHRAGPRRRARALQILGNHDEVALALGNLVENAVAYSPDGSTVVVGARANERMVELTVTDQGIGIPAASWTGSSSGSTGSTRPGTAPPAAPASASRSSSTSPPPTVARCASGRSRARLDVHLSLPRRVSERHPPQLSAVTRPSDATA